MGLFDFLKSASSRTSSSALEHAQALHGLVGTESPAEVMGKQIGSNAAAIDPFYFNEQPLWFMKPEDREIVVHLARSARFYRMLGCDILAWFYGYEGFNIGHTTRGLDGNQQKILVYRKVAVEDATRQPPQQRRGRMQEPQQQGQEEIRA